jgi:hypothetical protein
VHCRTLFGTRSARESAGDGVVDEVRLFVVETHTEIAEVGLELIRAGSAPVAIAVNPGRCDQLAVDVIGEVVTLEGRAGAAA